jgi:hypothetical protein
MKTKNLCSEWGLMAIFFLLISVSLQSQISIFGLFNEGEGAAGWDADGSGPEPYGNGHSNVFYYVASRDYVDPTAVAGGRMQDNMIGFPAFVQALSDNGFTAGQVKIKQGLASLGDDIEGVDWFDIGEMHYTNFYPFTIYFEINEELMVSGTGMYNMFFIGPSTFNQWYTESGYFSVQNVSSGSSPAVQAAAEAFMQDMEGMELRIVMQSTPTTQSLTGNGRNGAYFDYIGTVEKGLPQLPIQGLAVNHEGFAGWDANGTGPEPKRNGHDSQLYYIASREYDGIDPDPNACFARMLEDGMEGFQNFALQLAYRGFTSEQIKLKMDLRDLDEDVEGEDWSLIGNIHQVNFYHSSITAELNGEPLFGFVCDTMKSYQNLNNPSLGWWGNSAKTIVFDASASSSNDVQLVAQSFFKDLEDRQIHTETSLTTSATGTISSCGRSGGFWQINEAKIVASQGPGTIIAAGNVNGNWDTYGHPYIITGDITIPDGQTLTIHPGVWVKFTDRIHFEVQGCLIAEGNTSNTGGIVFTAVNPDLGWGHFEYEFTPITNDASVFKHCIFEWGYAPAPLPYNSPYNCGGAFAIRGFNKVNIENCVFRHNRALIDGYWYANGGAIALWNSNPNIKNSVFRNNAANCSGAITCFQSSPTIVNCLFYINKSLLNSDYGGGAMFIWGLSNPVLINNTFYNNESYLSGGAVEIGSNSNPNFINNIIWNNSAPTGAQISVSTDSCNVDITYNDIEGGLAGIGPYGTGTGVYENNMEEDPMFYDELALDFQLQMFSPVIDAGTPNATGLNLPHYDILHNVRIWDGDGDGDTIVDMGSFEYGAPPFITSIEKPVAGSLDLAVNFFPNPVNEIGIISYQLTQPSLIKIEIYNCLGQKVDELVNDIPLAGTHEIEFNAGNLKKGAYVLKMTTNSHERIFKFIKID